MLRKTSRCETRTGFLRESLGPLTFTINQQPIWQGETWDRRVECDSDTMLPCLLGPS